MPTRRRNKDRQNAFTLIELIAVLVILALVAGLGGSFLLSTVDSYDAVQARTRLVNRGRLAIEQMTRQIRGAVPNSVRVSASGDCVEFLPLVAGALYLNDVPDADNLASVVTAPFTLNSGSAAHVVIGALDSSEIYAAGSPSARVAAGALGAGPIFTVVPLASPHRFLRNSSSARLYMADSPLRFCLFGGDLMQYSNYGFSASTLTDLNPGGNADVMAEGVSTSGSAFALSPGTEDFNTALAIDLDFSLGSERIRLQQQILVRNVP